MRKTEYKSVAVQTHTKNNIEALADLLDMEQNQVVDEAVASLLEQHAEEYDDEHSISENLARIFEEAAEK